MNTNQVEELVDVEIGTGSGRALHVDIARPHTNPAQPMPAVLWIHGGAWRHNSHHGNPAAFLAAKGYFTASVEYRLSGEAPWPAQLKDCRLAVRWLRANAEKIHIDPDRIGCWGHSAGGHLASCLGTMGGQAEFEGKGGYPGISSAVQAVVGHSGPVDFISGTYRLPGMPHNDVHDGALTELFGAPYAQRADLWRQASPISHVHASNPPFLIIHGDEDGAVPIVQSQRFTAALEKAGVLVKMITVRGGRHSPMGPPGDPDERSLQEAILTFFDQHLRRI